MHVVFLHCFHPQDTGKCIISENPLLLCYVSILYFTLIFDRQVLSEIPQWNTAIHLDDTLTVEEIQRALQQVSSGKALGVDGIPAEVLKVRWLSPTHSSYRPNQQDLGGRSCSSGLQTCTSCACLQAQGRPHLLRQSLRDLSSVHCRQSASTCPVEPA